MAFCLVFGWRVFAQSPTESAKQLSSAPSQVDAQRKLSSSPTIHAASAIARYYRVICLVHLNGKGTAEDPFRPEYAPDESLPPDRMGILGWSMQISDDRKMAIVQYVAADRKALAPILDDKRGDIRVFEIGKETKGNIEKELRKLKKDFDLESLQVVAQ